MKKWEYSIYDTGLSKPDFKGNPDNEYELNYLGDKGWELVAIKKSNGGMGGDRFYFKREIEKSIYMK